jgi:hypothetical protein
VERLAGPALEDTDMRVTLGESRHDDDPQPTTALLALFIALPYARLRIQRRPSRRLSNTLIRHLNRPPSGSSATLSLP